jgi:hypothetical protein
MAGLASVAGAGRQFLRIAEDQQLWIADGWHARFNMPPDPEITAPVTDKPEQVTPPLPTNALLDYLDAVFAQTKTYSDGFECDLNRVLNEPHTRHYRR